MTSTRARGRGKQLLLALIAELRGHEQLTGLMDYDPSQVQDPSDHKIRRLHAPGDGDHDVSLALSLVADGDDYLGGGAENFNFLVQCTLDMSQTWYERYHNTARDMEILDELQGLMNQPGIAHWRPEGSRGGTTQPTQHNEGSGYWIARRWAYQRTRSYQ